MQIKLVGQDPRHPIYRVVDIQAQQYVAFGRHEMVEFACLEEALEAVEMAGLDRERYSIEVENPGWGLQRWHIGFAGTGRTDNGNCCVGFTG